MTETITLAHISDVHLGPLAGFHPRYWDIKRGLGFLNWHRGRRFVHQRHVADLIAADAAAQNPDHIAVTGDLANIGLPAEYDAALAWLDKLGPPERVTVVPGNHDIYSARLHGHSCLARWAPFMTSNLALREAGGNAGQPFPFVRRIGPVALVGLNSAVPTPPFVAAGMLGEAQLAALSEILKELRARKLIRVVLIHHPPLPGQAPPRRALRDADAFERVLEAEGAELVLHGHNHRDMLAWRQWSGGRVPVIGVGSASAGQTHKSEPLARYNLFRLSGSGSEARIERHLRGLERPDGPVVELSRETISSPAAAGATQF